MSRRKCKCELWCQWLGVVAQFLIGGAMIFVTISIARFTAQQAETGKRALETEEYELRYAFDLEKIEVPFLVWGDSIDLEMSLLNVCSKPLGEVMLAPNIATYPLDSLESWPRKWEPQHTLRGPIHVGRGIHRRLSVGRNDMQDVAAVPDTVPVFIWVRAFWKTPHGDGYGLGWSIEFIPKTKHIQSLAKVFPVWKHYPESQIKSIEEPQTRSYPRSE